MTPDALAGNLARLRGSVRRHCDTGDSCGCRDRRAENSGAARSAAAVMPLSWSTSTVCFESVSRDGAIRSQRDLHAHDSTQRTNDTTESLLGTDNDVFTYAGPVRYPQINPIALVFEPQLERDHTGLKRATPFDSGGLQKKAIRPKSSTAGTNNIVAFLRRHELAVSEYRDYLGDFLAAAFEHPSAYLSDSPGPLCETLVTVERGEVTTDARRWTFEVRFETRIELAWSLSAVFLPRALEKEPWCFDLIRQMKSRGVHHGPYLTTDGETAWDAIRSMSRAFIKERLEASRNGI